MTPNDSKWLHLKFIFFEKATTFDEISILLLTNSLCSVFPATVLNFNLCCISFIVVSGSQFWTLFTEPNLVMFTFFGCWLHNFAFVLSFVLSSNIKQLCRMKIRYGSQGAPLELLTVCTFTWKQFKIWAGNSEHELLVKSKMEISQIQCGQAVLYEL